jgi:hypothetical protein
MTTHMRHLYKAVAILALLVLVVSIYRQSTDLERADLGFDVPVAAATNSPSPVLNPRATFVSSAPLREVSAARPSHDTWAEAIDTVLRDNTTDVTAKSRRMLELLPHLPPALQAEAAQHLVNFATDAAPGAVVEPLLDCKIDPSAHGVLLLGLLQRADRIRLPTLLQIARNHEHAKCADALQYLHFLLESDDPANSAAWEARIEVRLRPLPPG